MAEVLVNQGRLEEATPLLEDAHRVFLASDWIDGASFVEVQLARILAADEDLSGALQLFERARLQYLELGETRSIAELVVYLAESYLEAGQPDNAIAALDEVATALGDESVVHSAGILRVRGTALADLGDITGAAEAINEGLEAAEQQGLPYEIALLLLAKARLETTTADEAEDMSRRGHEMLNKLGVRLHPELVSSA
jgi:tetratricopeptide (TPR) repeat protein